MTPDPVLTNEQRRRRHQKQDPDLPHRYVPRSLTAKRYADGERAGNHVLATGTQVKPCRLCGCGPLALVHVGVLPNPAAYRGEPRREADSTWVVTPDNAGWRVVHGDGYGQRLYNRLVGKNTAWLHDGECGLGKVNASPVYFPKAVQPVVGRCTCQSVTIWVDPPAMPGMYRVPVAHFPTQQATSRPAPTRLPKPCTHGEIQVLPGVGARCGACGVIARFGA